MTDWLFDRERLIDWLIDWLIDPFNSLFHWGFDY